MIIDGLGEAVATQLGLYDPTRFPPTSVPKRHSSTRSSSSSHSSAQQGVREYPRCCGCCCFSVRYSHLVFVGLFTASSLAAVGFTYSMLYAPNSGLPKLRLLGDPDAISPLAALQVGYMFVAFAMTVYTFRMLRLRANAQLLYSIFSDAHLSQLADRYVLASFVLGYGAIDNHFNQWETPTATDSVGLTAVWLSVLFVSYVTYAPVVLYTLLVLMMHHCATNVIAQRSKWIVREYTSALEHGVLDEGAAFRIIRSYGSILVLVEQVNGAAGGVAAFALFTFSGGAAVFFFVALDVVLTGDFDTTADAWNAAQDPFGGFVVALLTAAVMLYLPARLTAQVASTSKRLGFISSGAARMHDDKAFSAVSVAVLRSTSVPGTSLSGGSSSESDSDSSSLSSQKGRAAVASRRRDVSISDSVLCGCCPALPGVPCCGGSDSGSTSTSGRYAHPLSGSTMALPVSQPLHRVPSKSDGHELSLFRLGDAARYPVTGPVARIELELVSYIAGHLDKTASAEVGNIGISYSLIGRLVTSVLSVALLTLRLAAGSVAMIDDLCEFVITNIGLYDPTRFPPTTPAFSARGSSSSDDSDAVEYPPCCGCCCFSTRYSWAMFAAVVVGAAVLVVAFAACVLSTPSTFFPGYSSLPPATESEMYSQLLYVPFALSLVFYTFRTLRKRASTQLWYSILSNRHLRRIANRYTVGSFAVMLIVLGQKCLHWTAAAPSDIPHFRWIRAVNIVSSMPVYGPLALFAGIVLIEFHCTAYVVSHRGKWIEAEYVAALTDGVLDEGVALRIIRAYGSVLVLVAQVNETAGKLSAFAIVFTGSVVLFSFIGALDAVVSDDSGVASEAWAAAQPDILQFVFALLIVAAMLYVPARLTAAVSHVSKRLGFVSSGAVQLRDDYVAAPVSVTGRSASFTVASSSSSGTSSSGGSSVAGRRHGIQAMARKHSSSANDTDSEELCGCCAKLFGCVCGGDSEERGYGIRGQPGSSTQQSAGGTALLLSSPIVAIPSKCDGKVHSMYRLGDSARYPATGQAARMELELVSYIASHVEKTAVAEVANVGISYTLIGQLVTSVLSIGLLTLRLAAGLV